MRCTNWVSSRCLRNSTAVGDIGLFLLNVPATARQGQPAGQQNRTPQPAPNQKSSDKADERKSLTPPVDPSPYTGDETRSEAKDDIGIQRQISADTSTLAKDTTRIADYTYFLLPLEFLELRSNSWFSGSRCTTARKR